ncbi:MAG: DUF1573 domain-containing protein, partial [Thermoanaerobaculia bacterium]
MEKRDRVMNTFAAALALAAVGFWSAASPANAQTEKKKEAKPAAGASTAAPAPAAPAASAATAADPNGPKLVLPEDKKDVGIVAKGEAIKQVYVVKNAGKSDLHITDVKPSCGCTVPDFDKVIKPGGEGKITLTVDTKNFQGAISKTALVISDDPTTPQVTLFLTANVKPYIEAQPFGFFRIQALTGESATSELVIMSDEADFKPSKAEVTQSYLKVSMVPVAEKDRVAGKNPNQYKLTLTTAVDAPEGLLGGYVKVTTGLKKQPEFDIAISGYIKPTISISPLTVNFGNFDPKGDAVKRNVMIVNNNVKNETFSVTKAATSVPGIS